jgi:hypothetical protein
MDEDEGSEEHERSESARRRSERPSDHGLNEPSIRSPEEDAMCVEHPEHGAIAVCLRCGSNVCIACWQAAFTRCQSCLVRDPRAAAPPIAWETSSNVVSRFVRTAASALRPTRSAPGFLGGGTIAPRTFFLLSFVPLALVTGVVPFTSTLIFGNRFGVAVVGGANTAAIALDVGRAALTGLLMSSGLLLALALPYVSLTRAYAGKGDPDAPRRVVAYRAFLIPLGDVLRHLVAWGVPVDIEPEALAPLMVAAVIPLVLLFGSLRATARAGAGLGPFMSVVAALVAFIVMFLGQGTLEHVLAPDIDPQAAQRAQEALGASEAGVRSEHVEDGR